MQIKRDLYLQQLIVAKCNGLIKIITGIRRCGKSYLLFKLFRQYLTDTGVDDKHITLITLDDIKTANCIIPSHYIGILKLRLPMIACITFSLMRCNLCHDLSSDIITEFRGRGDEIHLYPLSLSEYCDGCGKSAIDAWGDYLTYGGLPHILTLGTKKKKLD